MQFRSNVKPSMYAYPEPLKPPKKEEKEKVCLYEEGLKEEESDFDLLSSARKWENRCSSSYLGRTSLGLIFKGLKLEWKSVL